MISKFKTIIWFLKRPSFYPFLIQLCKRRLFHFDDEYGKDKAIEFCKENEITEDEIYNQLFDQKFVKTSFVDNYSNHIAFANEKIKNVPVTMGGPGGLNLLFNLVKICKPNIAIETGVAYGWSSLAILSAMHNNKLGFLISIDMPYPKMGNEKYVGIAVPDEFKDSWELIKRPDRNGLKKALNLANDHLDLCHYDSDKSYTGRMWAYPLLWSKLNTAGIFISDDIQDNIAFIEFSQSVNRTPFIIKVDGKYVGVLKK